MNNYSIVIPNKYPEFAENLIESIRQTHNVMPDIVVIRDNHNHKFVDAKAYTVTQPFVFARSANCGALLRPKNDIILCNDDMTCTEPHFFDELHECANIQGFPVGIVSPLIDGGVGNAFQQFPPIWDWPDVDLIIYNSTICFPCVWINRKMINQIGFMDEAFVGYGGDDDDYCIRARNEGWSICITQKLHIRHGSGGNVLDRGKNWSCSFARVPNLQNNMELLRRKHNP